MRKIFLFSLLLGLAITGFAFSADPTEVVIYDSAGSNHYSSTACDNLGWPYTAYHSGSEASFRADVEDGCDIAIYDCPSNFEAASLDTLHDYVADDDGILILCFWYMSAYAGHDLWDDMEVTYISEYMTPLPVYIWDDTHDIFNNPNDLTSVTFTFYDNWARDGQRVEPITKGFAIAGYTDSEQTNQAALVINDALRTAFNGFCFDEGGPDSDDDDKVDIVELIENELVFLWEGPSSIQPASLGNIKALYH